MKRRVLALALAILAFFIFVGSPFEHAVEAVAGVDDAVIAVLIAALAAMGITFVVSASYGSLEEFVGQLIEEYAQERGIPASSVFSGWQTGSNRLGQILLNNRSVRIISVFGEWVKAKFNLQDNDTKNVVSGSSTWGGLDTYLMPFVFINPTPGGSRYSYEVYRSSGAPVYVLLEVDDANRTMPHFVSKGPAEIIRSWDPGNGNIVQDSPESLEFRSTLGCYYRAGGTYSTAFSNVLDLSRYTYQQIYEALSGDPAIGGAPIDIITGTIDLPTEDVIFDDEGGILDIDAPWGTGFWDIIAIIIPGIFSDDAIADPSITYEEENEVAEQVEDTATEAISQEASAYQVNGLGDVFPFCIPFDLYNFVSCLAADPVAPSFTWRFYVPGICDETIEIDFSEFDQAAQLLRTMELLLFCVGLAFVTRKIIRG